MHEKAISISPNLPTGIYICDWAIINTKMKAVYGDMNLRLGTLGPRLKLPSTEFQCSVYCISSLIRQKQK